MDPHVHMQDNEEGGGGGGYNLFKGLCEMLSQTFSYREF